MAAPPSLLVAGDELTDERAEPDARAFTVDAIDLRDVLPERTEAVDRMLDAALVLVARWGVAKTSLSDVAKEAGCSRATLYRAFPGGKRQLFWTLGLRELQGYVGEIVAVIDAAEDLDDALTGALVVAARLVLDHDAVQFILEHEPGLLLPFLGFHEVDRVYRGTAQIIGPHLERLIPADVAEPAARAERAEWAAEWAARIFITFLFNPADEGDLADLVQTRHLVRRFMLPAFDRTPRHPVSQELQS